MGLITATAPTTSSTDSARSPVPRRRAERTLVILEAVLSVGGLAGGTFMATHPTSVMSLHYLNGTWFHTWRWPGIALFFFVGVCPAAVAVATLLRFPGAAIGHLCVGVGVMAWILLEVTWVVVSPGLQIVVGAVGVAIFVLGVTEIRRSTHRHVTLDPGRRPGAMRR